MDVVAAALEPLVRLDRAARGDQARIADALRDVLARLAGALDTACVLFVVDDAYPGYVRVLAARSGADSSPDNAAAGVPKDSLRRFEDEAMRDSGYGAQKIAEAWGVSGFPRLYGALLDPMQARPATDPLVQVPLLVAICRDGADPAAISGEVDRAATMLWLALDRLDSDQVAPDGGPDHETVAKLRDENVQFTVYRPRALTAATWTTVLAFAHLAEARLPGDADPVTEVRDQAQRVLDDAAGYRDTTADATAAVPRGGALTFQLALDGCEINEPEQRFRWLEDVHRAEFRIRAAPALAGSTVRGALTVYLGPIVIGMVTLQVPVVGVAAAPLPSSTEAASSRAFRRVFPSYAHADAAMVEEAIHWATAIGDTYLQDIRTLRAGEVWNERLLELIRDADLFQLFWSSNAQRSEYVAQEYRHALSLGRREFIRPTYWESPCPPHPAELARLHFARLPDRVTAPVRADAFRAPGPITVIANDESPPAAYGAPPAAPGNGPGGAAGDGAPRQAQVLWNRPPDVIHRDVPQPGASPAPPPPPAPAAAAPITGAHDAIPERNADVGPPAAPGSPRPAPRRRRPRSGRFLTAAGGLAVVVAVGFAAATVFGGRESTRSAAPATSAVGGLSAGQLLDARAIAGLPQVPATGGTVADVLPALTRACDPIGTANAVTAKFSCPNGITATLARFPSPEVAHAFVDRRLAGVGLHATWSEAGASGTDVRYATKSGDAGLSWTYDTPAGVAGVIGDAIAPAGVVLDAWWRSVRQPSLQATVTTP